MKVEKLKEIELIRQFQEVTRHLLPKRVAYFNDDDAYIGSLYLTELGPHWTLIFMINSQRMEIRFSIDKDQLTVGWGGSNLLTTNLDSYNTAQIQQIQFIASIFDLDTFWMKAIKSIDLTPLIEAKEQAEKELAEKAAKEKELNLLAYKNANIEIGDEILLPNPKKFYKSVGKIERMSKAYIVIDRRLYSKEEVGEMLREKLWEIKKNDQVE